MRFSTKHLYACIFLVTLYATTKAQSTLDSTFITKKGQPQQKEFWDNKYNFPAKPRNMWEVGASAGVLSISGDVPVKLPTFGFEAHVRKAIGYLVSLRLQYVNGTGKGLNWQGADNFAKNPAWLGKEDGGNLPAGKGYNPAYRAPNGSIRGLNPAINGGIGQYVFYNYKTHVQDLSLQTIVSLNNIRFHKQKTGFTIYGGAGIGFTFFNVKVNALDAAGNNYTTLFNNTITAQNAGGGIQIAKRKDILKLLKAGMDNSYETAGESEGARRPKIGNNTLKPSGTILFGVAYKLGKRINLALENRHTFEKSDLMDGQQWQAFSTGDAVQTRDFDSWNFVSLGLNVNLGAKSTEPLWWQNPLDYAYSELSNPKHMKLPKPIFEDTDGDGVTDQLDREPNTPTGCPTDTHGVTRDTDGDGVPDCKDKQLITPSECQPVDADGVGACPEMPCCKEIKAILDSAKAGGKGLSANADCPGDYPSLTMKAVTLSSDNKAMLATVAAKLKEKPSCNIDLTAYPKTDKRQQALSVKKLEAVKNYLVEKLGISADRIGTNSVIEGGDANTIDIKTN
jgi:hypothetical protein